MGCKRSERGSLQFDFGYDSQTKWPHYPKRKCLGCLPWERAFTRGASRTRARAHAPINVTKNAFHPYEFTIEASGNPAFAAPCYNPEAIANGLPAAKVQFRRRSYQVSNPTQESFAGSNRFGPHDFGAAKSNKHLRPIQEKSDQENSCWLSPI